MIQRMIILFLFVASGCATTLQPAPGANVVPGPGQGAVAAHERVQVEARMNAWQGIPAALEAEVTPALVTVTNESDRPIRIRYNEFKLVSATGKEFAALPPFDVQGTISQPVSTLIYPSVRFGVAPYLSMYYPTISPFYGPFAYDSWYYGRYYPAFARIRLPTSDMIQKALPEGVIEPQGRATGFLYFEHVGDDVTRVEFRAELVDADTSQHFASVSIPFIATG